MKRSKTVTLVLLSSTMFLAGCERNMRNQYANWDDCVKDYGNKQCFTEREETSAGVYRSHYYGPWYHSSYYSNSRYNPSITSHRSTGTVRGGWGSSGSHSSS
jgi:hypothetical protein